MNILAQGLSNDGFLGGELADEQSTEWVAAHKSLVDKNKLILAVGDFGNNYNNDNIVELNKLVNKPYKTLPDLLNATKKIMKILRENDTYVNDTPGLKESDGYKKIQVLLGVNKSLDDGGIVQAVEGHWAKLISDLLGPYNGSDIIRKDYFINIIATAEADIMVFVEDDIMGEVINTEDKYTNILDGAGAGAGAGASASTAAGAATADADADADATAEHIEKANKYETDTRQSVELPNLKGEVELKNIEHGQAARAYKTNSNAVVAKDKILGKYHDGTSIYWKKDTITPKQISIFTISHETKKKIRKKEWRCYWLV